MLENDRLAIPEDAGYALKKFRATRHFHCELPALDVREVGVHMSISSNSKSAAICTCKYAFRQPISVNQVTLCSPTEYSR